MSYLAPVPSRDGKRLYGVGAQLRSEILSLEGQRQEFVRYLPDVVPVEPYGDCHVQLNAYAGSDAAALVTPTTCLANFADLAILC